ncbi:hypothetical protein D3C72_1716580 [compost metagenome]
MQLDLAVFPLDTVFRVDNFCAVGAAFDFAIGRYVAASRQAVLHRRVEVEEAHSQDAGAVADLAGEHAAAAKTDIAAQHFPFHRGKNARQQIVDWVEAGAVFVT